MSDTPLRLLALLVCGLPMTAMAADATPSCSASSGVHAARVVELYTSEGCSSCPPADRWVSRLRGQRDLVVLAFHVSYWDRLGWKDRFASSDYTERQAEQRRVNGAHYSYTPQVVVDGVDEPRWYAKPSPAPFNRPAPVRVKLQREGEGKGMGYTAHIQAEAGAPSRLAAYWAVTENGHQTAVKSGENEGSTLAHDFVVREFEPVPAWTAAPGKTVELSYRPSVEADAKHPRELNLVVLDAESGRPVQAIKVGC
jgi:hypothetical protein